MKGLLQSKIFRKNLRKWLCMYVGVLLLFTTVVTYSKFITNMQGDDEESKPAKFNVDVIGYGIKLEETPEGTTIYDAGLQRPNAPLTYYLKINTEFEVATYHDDTQTYLDLIIPIYIEEFTKEEL